MSMQYRVMKLSRRDSSSDDDDGDEDNNDDKIKLKTSSQSVDSLTGVNQSTFFRDGKRKIDFVLVYEEDNQAYMERKARQVPKGKSLKREITIELKREKWRQKFMGNLQKAGLHMEEELVESEKKMVYYIKLSVPWNILVFYAEDLCMRAPLQAHPNPSQNWSEKLLNSLHIPNIMTEEVPNQPLDYYTCPFKKSKLSRFLGSDNPDTYFTSTQRSRIAYEILQTTAYGKRKRAEIGIDRLLEEGTYSAAFPLHDGSYQKPAQYVAESSLNPRQVLFYYWAKWGKWYKYQPLDHIRDYFGEKIAIYFAWLGFYTGWLLPAAVVGLLVFLYGVFTMYQNTPTNETCDSGDKFKMCPLCSESIGCQYWSLSDICVYSRVGYLFDHPGTVFYAVFVSFWAVAFLEYWKRKSSSLAHHWDSLDFEEEEERPRPEFIAKAPFMEKNPITGIKEPAFPKSMRLPRMVMGVGVILIMMCLVFIFIVAVIMYRVIISIPLFQNKLTRSQAPTIASMSSACVNLILIMALGKVYEKLALRLTQWEMHRTQSEFDNHLTFKVFIFQFVNFYSSIFYIAFFKGRFVGYPGNYTSFFGLRNEECSNGGCLIELAQQLGVIMIGKQVINNIQEVMIPKIKLYVQQRKLKNSYVAGVPKTRWEEDYQLIENEGLFDEYLEMVLQFGFITIFVAAFPLAPLFALINNWVEIRLDAHKFVCETRRPVADRCQNIGIWFHILDSIAQIAVISNAFVIAFTSEFLPKLLYKYEYDWNLVGYVNFTLAMSPNGTLSEECRYRDFRQPDGSHSSFYWRLLVIRLAFVILFEHVVFGICRLIDLCVPDIPGSLELKIKRERYLAKQALADSDTIFKVARQDQDEDEDDVAPLTIPDNV